VQRRLRRWCGVMIQPRLHLLSLAALVPAASSWGLCNDKHNHCASWAKDGECEKDNKPFMQKECALSCGVCPLLCRDVEDACISWAKEGFCESNPTYMLKRCATSCGVCAVKCYDKEPGDVCGQWARHGECEKNPAILSSCPVSCGVCTSICLDKHNDCPNWAAAGDCSKNRAFMLMNCPRSCHLCAEPEGTIPKEEDAATRAHEAHDAPTPFLTPFNCANHDNEQCLLWGEQECGVNPEALLTDCPQLCGACTLACVDKAVDCPGWAAAKEGKACELDSHLPTMCPQSCGICSAIHVRAPPAKDEV